MYCYLTYNYFKPKLDAAAGFSWAQVLHRNTRIMKCTLHPLIVLGHHIVSNCPYCYIPVYSTYILLYAVYDPIFLCSCEPFILHSSTGFDFLLKPDVFRTPKVLFLKNNDFLVFNLFIHFFPMIEWNSLHILISGCCHAHFHVWRSIFVSHGP